MITKRTLFFLLPILIISLIYGYLKTPQQKQVVTVNDNKVKEKLNTNKKQQGVKVNTIGNDGFPRLRTDLLERESKSYPGVHKNLFSAVGGSGQIEVQEEVLPEPLPEEITPVYVPPPPPSPQEVAAKELALYKFVGFFKKGDKKTVFLSTAGEVSLVHIGDHLGRGREYYVKNITDSKMELHKKGVGDFSIKLIDQEALSAIFLKPAVSEPSDQQMQDRESSLPGDSQLLSPHDDLQGKDLFQFEEQPQPEEDNNETQN